MKTYIDNVCRHVIERHLLESVPNFFSPSSVAMLTDEELQEMAGEQDDMVTKRKFLNDELGKLRAGLTQLRK